MAEELDQSVVPPSMNNSEYEYVEVPETDAIQYEYVDENGNPIPPEMVNGDNIQYEYVDENGNPIDAENVQYEYVEQEENTPSLETPVADEDALEGYNVSQQAEMTNQQEELTVDMLGDVENSIPEESNAEQETAEVYEYVDENGNPVDPTTLENVEYTYEEVEVPSAEVGNMEESSEIVGVSDLETPVEEVPVPEVVAEPEVASESTSISDLETPVEEVSVPEVVAEPEIASEGASISDLETPVEEVPVPEVVAEPEIASEGASISDLETPVEEAPVPEVVAEPEIASEGASISDLETPVEEVPVPKVATEPGIASEGVSISDLETPVEEVPVPEVVAEPEIASEGASISDLETPVEEVPVSEVAAEPELPPEDGFSEDGEIPNFEGTTEPDLPSEDFVQENNYEQKISDETDSMDDKIARISVVAETMASSAYVYSGEKTEHSSSAEIVLDNTKGAFNNLKNWHLLITEMSVNQIEGQGGQVIELSEGVYNQGFIITGEGEQINFANVDKVEIPVSEIDACTLFVSATVETTLAEQAGQIVELENSNGMLIGPNGVKLTFNHVNKITVPEKVEEHEVVNKLTDLKTEHFKPSQQPVAVALFQDAPKETECFVFDENSGEKTVQGGAVLVKTGYSLYGWNVHFENGLTMSLADVRTFEALNNSLPTNKGEITYKNAKLIFENVENIKVYEQPAYCGYGVNS